MNTNLVNLTYRTINLLEPVVVVLMLYWLSETTFPTFVRSSLFNHLIYAVVGFLILKLGKWQRFAYVLVQDPFLLSLIALAVLSYFWSSAPAFTSDEVKPLLRAYFLGAYLASRYTLKQQLYLFAWVCGLTTVLSIVVALMFPGIGISTGVHAGLWKGVFGHKNLFGRMMCMSAITFLEMALGLPKQRRIALVGAALSLGLLLLSGGKTSLVIVVVALPLLFIKDLVHQKSKLRLFLLTTTFLILSSLAFLFISNFEFLIVDVLDKSLTLSGRLPLWELCIHKGMERPWLGFGHVGFWTSPESVFVFNNLEWGGEFGGESRMHAHSGVVDFFLQYGFVGFSLLIMSLSRLVSNLLKMMTAIGSVEYFWGFQYLMIFLFFNINITNSFMTGNVFWIFYCSIAISVALQANRLQRKIPRFQTIHST